MKILTLAITALSYIKNHPQNLCPSPCDDDLLQSSGVPAPAAANTLGSKATGARAPRLRVASSNEGINQRIG
jgi:hypothetical protein